MNSTIASAKTDQRAHKAAKIRSVELTGPAGRLEAILNEGEPDAPFAALVCHPHPLAGGTMDNKVVYHAMKAINSPAWGLGWPVLRFNFRGTGLSHGIYDGEAEMGDVLAALGLPLHASREYHYPSLSNCVLPKLFLSGEYDQFAPHTDLEQLILSAADPKQLVLLSGADHFFTGQLELMQKALAGWLKELEP
jgi:alpha/beta superfamily hydrolase